VDPDLIRIAPPKAAAPPRPKGNIWGDPLPSPRHSRKDAAKRRAAGATVDEFARSYNVSRAMISRLRA
jgi:hypothetical protein